MKKATIRVLLNQVGCEGMMNRWKKLKKNYENKK